MSSVLRSSSFALNWRFPFRSMFRLQVSLQHCLRAIWFGNALAFAVFNLAAEIKLAIAMDGRPRMASVLIAEVDQAVSLFPFDLRLRSYQRWVYSEVARRERDNAEHQRETAPVHGGSGPQP